MKSLKKGTKWFYWFTLLVAIVVVYKVLDNFTDIGEWIGNLIKIIQPFLYAILLSYLLYIPCRKIEKIYKKSKYNFLTNRSRSLAVATTYLLVLLAIIIVINIVFPILYSSILELASSLPGYYDVAMKYIEDLPKDSFINGEILQEPIKKLSEIDLTQILSLDNIVKKIVGVGKGIFNAFVTIVVSIYILLERGEILKFIKRLNSSLFDEKRCNIINRYYAKGNEIFFKYISGQILDALAVGIIMSIVLIIMRVKYAILLGFIIGLFNLIPYFGAIVAVIVTCLITIFTGGIPKAIWLAIILTVLQQIDANIINPKILKDALKISRILIIFSITVFGAYFGVLGMFLGVPAMGVIKMMVDDYIERNENKKVKNDTTSNF